MTGISTDFMSSPRYQRAVQKISAMSPDQQRVLDTVAADRAFADQEMLRKLRLARMGAAKKAEERSLASGRQRTGMAKSRFRTRKKHDKASMGLSRKIRKWEDKQRKRGELIDLGNAALSTWMTLKGNKKKPSSEYMYKRQYPH